MALDEMIIIDELPFMFVEHEGFIRFIGVCCPRFDIPSRKTIREDCFRLFIAGRVKLKEFFKNTCAGRVSITTDGWTSVQNFNYICVTAHYVGKDWKLHKKIINFRRIQSHKGVDVGEAVANCLEEWGLKSLFTVTVDNASSNDTAVTYLKDKLYTWGTNMMGGKYLHMRCVAHIVNVGAGLEEMGLSVRRVREAVRWVVASPAREQSFQKNVDFKEIESSRKLCLDVPTRWNSTFLMLDVAALYEYAFKLYEQEEPIFKIDLEAKRYKDVVDWKSVRTLTKYLKFFYELTLVASGTKYVTSHLFLKELSRLVYHVYKMERNDDEDIRNMAFKMKDKVFKYWSEHEETNVRLNHLMYLAPIFDPRYRWSIITYTLPKLHGSERGEELCIEIREELIAMFNVYKENHERTLSLSTTSLSSQGKTTNVEVREGDENDGDDDFFDDYTVVPMRVGERAELDKFLSGEREEMGPPGKSYDVLGWWKGVAHKFPVVSEMAKDILAVPISTVASESCFSTGGRVLDNFRSSLTPHVVEALICAEDWLRTSYKGISNEEKLEDLQALDQGNYVIKYILSFFIN
ncbi:Putative AC transposase [Linum perenne]